jgi:hypothetical protein
MVDARTDTTDTVTAAAHNKNLRVATATLPHCTDRLELWICADIIDNLLQFRETKKLRTAVAGMVAHLFFLLQIA